MIGVHLLTFLQARGLDLAAAVVLGALVGPSQVGALVVEMARSLSPCSAPLGKRRSMRT